MWRKSAIETFGCLKSGVLDEGSGKFRVECCWYLKFWYSFWFGVKGEEKKV